MAASLKPTGIVDIGSNSVRFVAYAGAARVPSHLFNEKISPALGRGVERDGRLDPKAMDRALAALARYRQLARDMRLRRMHVVATAAVRDASNGEEFLNAARKIGLDPVVLSGKEEAELAAMGVISAIPDARGIVADLGGGSLELAWVEDRAIGKRVSLPLGVLRVGSASVGDLRNRIRDKVKGTPLDCDGAALYLVGGSFRAIAKLDLIESEHPLPIIHQHVLTRDRLKAIGRLVADGGREWIDRATDLSSSRVEALPAAMTVLEALVRQFDPEAMVTSAYGLREGLLYRDLDEATRKQDPLLAGVLEVGETLGRFGDHGATIDRWIDPLFPDDGPAMRRLRLASCLLGDVAWNAHPEFRAERSVDMAIHGNWVGIDAHGRALIGRTLCTALSGDHGLSGPVGNLLSEAERERASAWGKAIRLAQRLSGGTERALLRTSLALTPECVILKVRDLRGAGEVAERRLAQLAKALGRDSQVEAT